MTEKHRMKVIGLKLVGFDISQLETESEEVLERERKRGWPLMTWNPFSGQKPEFVICAQEKEKKKKHFKEVYYNIFQLLARPFLLQLVHTKCWLHCVATYVRVDIHRLPLPPGILFLMEFNIGTALASEYLSVLF